ATRGWCSSAVWMQSGNVSVTAALFAGGTVPGCARADGAAASATMNERYSGSTGLAAIRAGNVGRVNRCNMVRYLHAETTQRRRWSGGLARRGSETLSHSTSTPARG